MRDPEHQYASDPRSSKELIEAHRRELESDEDTVEAMAILHFRGGTEEFEIGNRLIKSTDPDDRSIGADILAQLGGGDQTFHDESVNILINLLHDPDPYVIYCAAVGLGHRRDVRAIEPLIELVEHEDPQVRYGIAFGLLCHDDERALTSLIQLSRDLDHDTRNWAIFGLGSQTDVDTPAIRGALFEGLADPDSEIRGEALVGLARRKDPQIHDALLKEWELHEITSLSLEAAEELADPTLAPHLHELQIALGSIEDEIFQGQLIRAISACRPKTEDAIGSQGLINPES